MLLKASNIKKKVLKFYFEQMLKEKNCSGLTGMRTRIIKKGKKQRKKIKNKMQLESVLIHKMLIGKLLY
jgi:hypothetical protein